MRPSNIIASRFVAKFGPKPTKVAKLLVSPDARSIFEIASFNHTIVFLRLSSCNAVVRRDLCAFRNS